jgi:chorismate synthase
MDRRKPGQSKVTTNRSEVDKVEILSGIYDGLTTGAPICIVVWNKDVDSTVYEKIRCKPRPGHADLSAHFRYGGYNDPQWSCRIRLT